MANIKFIKDGDGRTPSTNLIDRAGNAVDVSFMGKKYHLLCSPREYILLDLGVDLNQRKLILPDGHCSYSATLLSDYVEDLVISNKDYLKHIKPGTLLHIPGPYSTEEEIAALENDLTACVNTILEKHRPIIALLITNGAKTTQEIDPRS